MELSDVLTKIGKLQRRNPDDAVNKDHGAIKTI